MADLRALVASPHWRWMAGTLTAAGLRVDGVSEEGRPVRRTLEYSDFAGKFAIVEHYASRAADGPDLPDVTDPATVGCLLDILYRAEGAHVTPSEVGVNLALYGLTDPRTVDAIVDAILAAPPPGTRSADDARYRPKPGDQYHFNLPDDHDHLVVVSVVDPPREVGPTLFVRACTSSVPVEIPLEVWSLGFGRWVPGDTEVSGG